MEEEQQDLPHAVQIGERRAVAVYTVWGAFSTMRCILVCCQGTCCRC